ncbi:MAG TPA: LpqB family beta-propeller domain-containing protein [Gaiellaceae bacterium]|nr:LpqB family beta-propeller domain-containing protein [Gaiellaceae bacterium]
MRTPARRSLLGFAAISTMAVSVLSASTAGAFPGANGAIVFQSAGRAGKGDVELWLRSPSGKLTDLTNNGAADTEPAVSPDGKKVAFVSNRDGNDEIYVMSITGGRATRLTHDTTADEEPSWSPDGKQIAYVDARAGHDEIAVMNADGSGAHLLTNTPTKAANGEPAWSPDGTRIAFSSNAPQQAIYTMKPDGSNVTLVTATTVLNVNPAWSPDATRIAYADRNDLWIVPAAGGAPTQLTHRGITTAAPHWSPDGSKLVFWSRSSSVGNDDEFVVDAGNGGAVTQLTNDPADDRYADWAPGDPLTSVALGSAGCPATTTARRGRIQWNFSAAGEVKDASGLGLFDSGSHSAPYTFWTSLSAAGLYRVSCGTRTSGVTVPVTVSPSSGKLTTRFAVSWGGRRAPSGFVYDVQVKAPGAAAFRAWQSGVTQPSSRYKATKAGSYAFEARLRRSSDKVATAWSLPVSIRVKGTR